MKKYILIAGVILGSLNFAHAQKTQTPAEQANYTQVITDRSAKIVNVLGIKDSAKYKRVEAVLIDQYRTLSNIHDTRNAQVATLNDDKKQPGADKAADNAKIAAIDTDVVRQLNKQHVIFLAKLSKDLDADQIGKVKDEMTYKVLEVTYNAYIDEIPTLTDAQKLKIKNWLIEARELAIDAESSKAKHGWFDKYKGRINNYLSAQGYDLKKENEGWQQRNKDKAAQK